MYKLCIKLIYLLVPILLILLVTNLYVDGGNLLGGINKQVAEIIVSGKNAGIKNDSLKWASLQVSIVNQSLSPNIRKPKDILVFGTSRSSEISSQLFTDTFFNCVVPGGNILDYIALYGLYKKNKMLPKYIIINIDPWSFFNRKSETVNGKYFNIADTSTPLQVHEGLDDYLEYGLNSVGININNTNNTFSKVSSVFSWLQRFSPEYFKLSLESLLSFPFGPVFITDKEKGSYLVIRKDGSYSFMEESEVDNQLVKASSIKFADAHKGRFFMFDKTNKLYLDCLYSLMGSLSKDGVVPIVYFSPINPIVFDELIKYEKNDFENRIKEYCNKNNFIALGSYNPHAYGISETAQYFIDAYHPVKSVVKKIFYKHGIELGKAGIIVQRDTPHWQ